MSGGEVTAVNPQAAVPGSTVGPWLILERLDSGTFGVVFRAQRAGHAESPPVALKLARNPQDPRFVREAELLRRCEHRSIPGYEDMGMWTGPKRLKYPYVVMEWVEGLTLYDWFREQQRSSREERRQRPSFPAWLSLASAGLVSGLVVALVVLLVVLPSHPKPEPPPEPAPWLATPEELQQFATDGGVAEEALASAEAVPRAVLPPAFFLGLPMPKDPIPGQKKPPCEPDIQKVINGGCWVGPLGTRKPPCGGEAFDYDDGCYMPVFPAPRKPTSGTP